MQNVFSAKPGSGQEESAQNLQAVFAPEASLHPDAIANKEAVLIADGFDIEKDGKKQEHNRHQSFRNHVNKATIALFWIIAGSLLLGIAAYVWHMVTPPSWHYLSAAQLGELKTVLVTAITSSVLTQYVKKHME